MGTYYNPGLQKSLSSNTGRGDSADAGLLTLIKSRQAAIVKGEERNKANWKLRQDSLAITDAEVSGFLKAGEAKGLDIETLNSSVTNVMKTYADIKIKLSQATGKYPGYESDEAFVRNTKRMIDNAATTFGALKFTVDGFNKTMKNGFGDKPGDVDSRSVKPGFMAMNEMARTGSNIKGTITWEMDYDESSGWAWKQVAKGESIKEANKTIGIDSDTFVLSYQDNLNHLNNSNRSEYNHGVYSTIPTVGDESDDKFLQEQKIYNEDYALEDKYFVPGKVTAGDAVWNTKKTNVKKLYNDLEATSSSIFYRIAEGANTDATDAIAASAIRAYVGNGVEEEVINGLTQFVYHKPSFKKDGTLRRNEDGTIYKDENNKVILGDDELGGGQFIRVNNEENGQRYGFNKEQEKEYKDWVQYQMLWNTGAFVNPANELNVTETKLLRQKNNYNRSAWNKGKGKRDIETLIRNTSEGIKRTVEAGDIEGAIKIAQDLAGLNSGGTIESDPNNASMIKVFGPLTVTGKKSLKWEGDATTSQGLQNLLSLFGVGTVVTQPTNRGDSDAEIEAKEAKKKADFDYDVRVYTDKVDDDDNTFGKRKGKDNEFVSSFLPGELDRIGIKLETKSLAWNTVIATDKDGKKTSFDPSTKEGKATWKKIVEAQLSKGETKDIEPDTEDKGKDKSESGGTPR